jgi:hypothetical protein
MAVNDVRIAVTVSAQRAGHCIEQWVREDGLKATNGHAYAITASGAERDVAIIPDAYFVLGLEGRRAHFFLEVDRATETNGRWALRVRAYLA